MCECGPSDTYHCNATSLVMQGKKSAGAIDVVTVSLTSPLLRMQLTLGVVPFHLRSCTWLSGCTPFVSAQAVHHAA